MSHVKSEQVQQQQQQLPHHQQQSNAGLTALKVAPVGAAASIKAKPVGAKAANGLGKAELESNFEPDGNAIPALAETANFSPVQMKQYFEKGKSWTEEGFTIFLKPAVNRSLEDCPFVPFFPDELFSGLYTYRLRVICPAAISENSFSARIMTPVTNGGSSNSSSSNNSNSSNSNNSEAAAAVPVDNSGAAASGNSNDEYSPLNQQENVYQYLKAGYTTWQFVDNSGLSKFELLTGNTKLVKNDQCKQVEFNIQLGVNSHNFNKQPFIFQVLCQGRVVFESAPFKTFARRPNPNSCFWVRNFCRRAKSKK